MPSIILSLNVWMMPTLRKVAMARRSRSASSGVNPAATMAMLHRLLLKQRHAQGLAQDLLQLRRG